MTAYIIPLLALVVSAASGEGGETAQPAPLAMALECRGVVEFCTAAQQPWRPLASGARLYRGNFVRTEAKSRAQLLLNDNSIINVGADQVYAVGEAAGYARSKPSGFWSKLTSLFGSSMSSVAATRSVDDTGPIALEMPGGGRLADPGCVFTWSGGREAPGPFVVTVTDRDGNDVWQTTTDERRIEIRAGDSPLKPGQTYRWSVARPSVEPAWASFSVLERGAARRLAAEAEKAAKATPDLTASARHARRALYLQERGLYLEAERALLRAKEKAGDPTAYDILIDAVHRGARMSAAGLVEIRFPAWRAPGAEPAELDPAKSNPLPTGAQFQFHVRAHQRCRLWAAFLDSRNEAAWLFPRDGAPEGLLLEDGGAYILPAPESHYTLDENAGREVLCIVVAPDPLPDAATLPARLKAAAANLDALRETFQAAGAQVHLLVIDHQP